MTGAERRFSNCASGQARKFLESFSLIRSPGCFAGVLLHFGVCFAADRASSVSGVQGAVRIAEERPSSGAPVLQRSCREFVFCRSAERARTDDHVTNGVAVFHSVREVGIEEPGSLAIRRTVKGRP